jgi:hypothetical protein
MEKVSCQLPWNGTLDKSAATLALPLIFFAHPMMLPLHLVIPFILVRTKAKEKSSRAPLERNMQMEGKEKMDNVAHTHLVRMEKVAPTVRLARSLQIQNLTAWCLSVSSLSVEWHRILKSKSMKRVVFKLVGTRVNVLPKVRRGLLELAGRRKFRLM